MARLTSTVLACRTFSHWFLRVTDDGHPLGPMVTFWDMRQQGEGFAPCGQRTPGQYYVDTLLEREGFHALSLDMGVPSWTVSADDMAAIVPWLFQVRSEVVS